MNTTKGTIREMPVHLTLGQITLEADLAIPQDAKGLTLFAHGSGSSRFSSRNRYVAQYLQRQGIATLLLDLLTPNEEQVDNYTMRLRFDIGLLAGRLSDTTAWIASQRETRDLAIGYFGASTGAAAALIAETRNTDVVKAIVSRGGRPDLAGRELSRVQAPTLLIVGGSDEQVIQLNEQAMEQMNGIEKLIIIPGATHLFEEPGTLETAAQLAAKWFLKYLSPA